MLVISATLVRAVPPEPSRFAPGTRARSRVPRCRAGPDEPGAARSPARTTRIGRQPPPRGRTEGANPPSTCRKEGGPSDHRDMGTGSIAAREPNHSFLNPTTPDALGAERRCRGSTSRPLARAGGVAASLGRRRRHRLHEGDRSARVERPVASSPYGRKGVLRDPFGHRGILVTEPGPPPPQRHRLRVALGDRRRCRRGVLRPRPRLALPARAQARRSPGGRQSLGHGLWTSEAEPSLFCCSAVDSVPEAVERIRAAGGVAGPAHREPYGLGCECVDDQGCGSPCSSRWVGAGREPGQPENGPVLATSPT